MSAKILPFPTRARPRLRVVPLTKRLPMSKELVRFIEQMAADKKRGRK
jgi:hypothetical protein